MYPDLVLSDEEYNALEDAMHTASMGSILVAEAGHSGNTVMATSKEVSAFLTLLERSLRFVYEGVGKRAQARATNECANGAAPSARGKERKAIARMEAMIDEAIRGGIYPPHLRGQLIEYASFGESELADYIAEAAAAKKEFEKGAKADQERADELSAEIAREVLKYKEEQRAAGVEVGTQEAVDFVLDRKL